jgi:hypothetical protein
VARPPAGVSAVYWGSVTLREWLRRCPAGSRAAGLIALWQLRGASLEGEATREQALTLEPLLRAAKHDPGVYEINARGSGLVRRVPKRHAFSAG